LRNPRAADRVYECSIISEYILERRSISKLKIDGVNWTFRAIYTTFIVLCNDEPV